MRKLLKKMCYNNRVKTSDKSTHKNCECFLICADTVDDSRFRQP
nr:MAG TPA: hypothetical protein [Caudoviricetes sp.]